MIYFVQPKHGGLIKIGVAQNVVKRLVDLQVGSPVELALRFSEEGDKDRELELHQRWGRFRVRGEWFYASQELAEYCGAIPSQDDDVEALSLNARESGRWAGFEESEDRFSKLRVILMDILGNLKPLARGIYVHAPDEVEAEWPKTTEEIDAEATVRRLALAICDWTDCPEGYEVDVNPIDPYPLTRMVVISK